MTSLRDLARIAAPCAVGITCFTIPHQAEAELREAVERVADAWRSVGAAVAVDRTRFLSDDSDDQRPIVIALPDLPEGRCTTVVLIGARGLGFHVRSSDGVGDDPEAKRVPSVAGALSLEQCGDAPPHRLVVASDSGRGALETVVARSAWPLPALQLVLPERAGGVSMPVSEPGFLPPLPPPAKRAEIAEVRAKRDGAAISMRVTWQAGLDGVGGGNQTLGPGCHTFRLFAIDPGASRPAHPRKLDLDAEMRDESDDRVLARDRTDAPDAQLVACVGETTRVDIVFAGSPPVAPVLVAHFAWPMPDHLPKLWGAEARGRIAHVLLSRHVASLLRDPIMLAQGATGTTPIPLTLEPGGCYLAMSTSVQEASRGIGLRIHIGPSDAFDDRGIEGDGAVVAFCAGNRDRALAEVEARGAPSGWCFALYRLQSGVWEAAW